MEDPPCRVSVMYMYKLYLHVFCSRRTQLFQYNCSCIKYERVFFLLQQLSVEVIVHMMISTHTYLFHVLVVQIKFRGVQKEQNEFLAGLHVPAYDEHKTQSSGSELWMYQSNTMATNTK